MANSKMSDLISYSYRLTTMEWNVIEILFTNISRNNVCEEQAWSTKVFFIRTCTVLRQEATSDSVKLDLVVTESIRSDGDLNTSRPVWIIEYYTDRFVTLDRVLDNKYIMDNYHFINFQTNIWVFIFFALFSSRSFKYFVSSTVFFFDQTSEL